MRLQHGTWVIVADGEKALYLVNAGTPAEVRLELARRKEIDNPPTSEQGTDKPGRFDDAGIGRSAVDDTDWHQLEKERFAEDLADELRKDALANRFSALVIIAPAKTLGTIRQALHKETQDRLVADLDKDLTNHAIADIEKILSKAET
jgi:protein required for attachment to host cells